MYFYFLYPTFLALVINLSWLGYSSSYVCLGDDMAGKIMFSGHIATA